MHEHCHNLYVNEVEAKTNESAVQFETSSILLKIMIYSETSIIQ